MSSKYSERVNELVNMKLSDLVPMKGLRSYLNRNDDPDGSFGPFYSNRQFFQAITNSLLLASINVGYALAASYGAVKGIEAIIK